MFPFHLIVGVTQDDALTCASKLLQHPDYVPSVASHISVSRSDGGFQVESAPKTKSSKILTNRQDSVAQLNESLKELGITFKEPRIAIYWRTENERVNGKHAITRVGLVWEPYLGFQTEGLGRHVTLWYSGTDSRPYKVLVENPPKYFVPRRIPSREEWLDYFRKTDPESSRHAASECRLNSNYGRMSDPFTLVGFHPGKTRLHYVRSSFIMWHRKPKGSLYAANAFRGPFEDAMILVLRLDLDGRFVVFVPLPPGCQ